MISFLAFIGVAVSAYAYVIEKRFTNDPANVPMCDISKRVSCTAALTSPYSKMLFGSNSRSGIGFYFLFIVLDYLNANTLLLLGSIAACLLSLFLAWILITKIKSLCILCVTLYIVNLSLLYQSYMQW